MLIGPPVKRGRAPQWAPEGKETARETEGFKPRVNEQCETVRNASSPTYWEAWKLDLLWVGLFVIGLAVGSRFPIKGHPGHWQMGAQNPVLRGQTIVFEEQFLVDQTGHVRQQSQPLVVLHAERP